MLRRTPYAQLLIPDIRKLPTRCQPPARGSHLNGGEEHDFAQAYFFDVTRSRDPETDPSYGSLVERRPKTAAAA
jgi:hypothetical protein